MYFLPCRFHKTSHLLTLTSRLLTLGVFKKKFCLIDSCMTLINSYPTKKTKTAFPPFPLLFAQLHTADEEQ